MLWEASVLQDLGDSCSGKTEIEMKGKRGRLRRGEWERGRELERRRKARAWRAEDRAAGP